MLARNPGRFFQRLGRGRELFEFRVPGIAKIYATGSSTVAKQIFAAPAGTFAPLPNIPTEPLLGSNSMMILDGQRHARERRLMIPCFCPEKISAFATHMINVTKDEIIRLPEGVPIDLNQMMQRITLSVIVDVIFGMAVPEEKAVFIAATEKFPAAYTTSLMLIHAIGSVQRI
jgi:cytochrome P450 family 110